MSRYFKSLPHLGRRIGIVLVAAVLCALVLTGLWASGRVGQRVPDATGTAAPRTAETATSPSPAGAAASNPPLVTSSGPVFGTPSVVPVPTDPPVVPDYVLPTVTDGMVPVLTKVPTEQKVVFLTIDDGATKSPQDLKILQDNGIKASLFLAQTFVNGNPAFFTDFVAAGSVVEDHSVSHALNLIRLPYTAQKAEICQMADFVQQHYGRRPVFFRPPGGPYTNVTRKAAADCGMKAIIDWEAKANAGKMDYQYGAALRPGDIVLMHFRPEFAADMQVFLAAQKAAGLKVVLLEDYLKTG